MVPDAVGELTVSTRRILARPGIRTASPKGLEVCIRDIPKDGVVLDLDLRTHINKSVSAYILSVNDSASMIPPELKSGLIKGWG